MSEVKLSQAAVFYGVIGKLKLA